MFRNFVCFIRRFMKAHRFIIEVLQAFIEPRSNIVAYNGKYKDARFDKICRGVPKHNRVLFNSSSGICTHERVCEID